MQVIKRNGSSEDVNLDKILNSLTNTCEELDNIDVFKIATKTIGGLYNNASTVQIDNLSIETAIGLIIQDPEYAVAAARILMNVINKEVEGQEIQSFSQSITHGYKNEIISEEVYQFVKANARKLNSAVKSCTDNDNLFEYFGLKTVYDRYLLRTPDTRAIFETPQYFFMRAACGLFHDDPKDTVEFFRVLSTHKYMTSTPTLFNSGTRHTQMSSCYLLNSPDDDLKDIYKRYSDIAMLSKFSGGIGVSFSEVRGEGSLIKGTNGISNGIIPFIHTLDSSVMSVNQGGRRKGACCVYLETWHSDILDFLDLKKQTGDESRRAFNLNFANWVPDEFMRRVKANEDWTLMSPNFECEAGKASDLIDLFADEFVSKYKELELALQEMEVKPRWYKVMPAQELYAKMMQTLGTTGNGWMNFKDSANLKANQVNGKSGYTIKISNLCVSKDTLIKAIIDGRKVEVRIDELTELYNTNSDILVLSKDIESGEISYKKVTAAGITGTNKKLLRIKDMETGKYVDVTTDHPIYTKNRGWVLAAELTASDELDLVDEASI